MLPELTPENRSKIIALLNEGICPLCGKKFIKPLFHINRVHGISRNEFKDMLLIPRTAGFASDELRELNRQTALKHNLARNFTHNKAKPGMVTKNKMSLKRLENIKKQPGAMEKVFNKKSVIRISKNGETKTYDSIANAIKDPENTKGVYNCIKKQRPDANGNRWLLACIENKKEEA